MSFQQFQTLENYVTVEPRPYMPSHPDMPTVQILDAMALVQSLRFAGATIFGETKYFDVFTTHYQQRCHRLDVVFDCYWQLSIKADKRQK